MHTAQEVAAVHAENGCNCCGRKLNPRTMTWLELSFKTGKWYRNEGECPADESQGWHAFGQACARRVIREQNNQKE